MNDELRRILALVKDGKLTEEQAASMIEALDGPPEPPPAPEAPRLDDEDVMHDPRGRRRRKHRREYDSEMLEELGLNIGKEVASIVNKSLKGLSSVIGTSTRGRFGPTMWLNESNVNVMSKLHTPTGDEYECRDNSFTVSRLDEVNLSNATFSDNEAHAGSLKDINVDNGHFNGNELRGSSLKDISIDSGDLSNCQFNGAQVSSVSIDSGKLDDCRFNGAQMRDLTIDNGTLAESLFNGAKLADINVLDGSTIREIMINGARVQDCTIEASTIEKLRLDGVNVQALHVEHCILSDVVFRNREWREYIGYNGRLPSPPMTDLSMEHFKCTDTRFTACTFENTLFKDCEISGLTFTEVDFTGLTLETPEAFMALADQQAA